MSKDSNSRMLEKRPLYSDEILNTIKNAILSQELKPGERVVETTWAKELGVSKSPVREAIRELAVMGLIENRPYQGAFVRKIDKQEMIDSYYVRMSLEMLGVQYAVRDVTPEQIDEIYIIMKEMERAVEVENFALFIEKDGLFHQKILDVSRNKLLIQLWNQCKILENTKISAAISHLSLEALAKRHETMYETIKSRDEAAALSATQEHFILLIDQLKQFNLEDM